MKLKKYRHYLLAVLSLVVFYNYSYCQTSGNSDEELLKALHSISSHKLFSYIEELTSDKYEGLLTGTKGYNMGAAWVAKRLNKWGILPLGENDTYYQYFDIPYTLVYEDCEVYLHLTSGDNTIKKYYKYIDEFVPGSTSGSGTVTSDVVYVGYGISAPELGYDEYDGVDVKGKIVLMEREAPVSPNRNPELFKKWRPYSFHQYKLENAVKHGAKGMLYNYGPIGNPNNAYNKDFIYSHVGDSAVSDIFSGTGKDHGEIIGEIRRTLKPMSFETGKLVTIKNTTEHFPDGKGKNVIGYIEGSDNELKDEVIIIGAHLDHLGKCYEIMPGANDNISGVSVLLGVAEALSKSPEKLKRSVMFIFFGAEEQAIVGSKAYLEDPAFPLDKTLCLINMDGVGCGDKLSALAANNYPAFWNFMKEANENYIHRIIRPSYFANLARPRLDAARFLWAGVPTISMSAYGSPSYYHLPLDNISTITPEIMEDLAQLLFLTVLNIDKEDKVNFRDTE